MSTAQALPKRPFPWMLLVGTAITAAILVWSIQGTKFNLWVLAAGMPNVLRFFKGMLPPWPMDFVTGQLIPPMVETIRIALAASMLGAALALPVAFMASSTVAPNKWVYQITRNLLNLIRTIPDLVLAALLASAFGIGAFPGFLALLVFSFGVVAKLLADTVETIDRGPMDAIATTGATRILQARHGVFPQIAPEFIAYTLYAFEINVRAATVLGLVGAGGVGVLLKPQIAFLNYTNVGIITAVTFGVVMLIDTLSSTIRRRLV